MVSGAFVCSAVRLPRCSQTAIGGDIDGGRECDAPHLPRSA